MTKLDQCNMILGYLEELVWDVNNDIEKGRLSIEKQNEIIKGYFNKLPAYTNWKVEDEQ